MRIEATTRRAYNSSGGSSLPPRRIIMSRFAAAEPTTQRTMVHIAPNTQLRIMVCMNVNPSGIALQNSARTFRNR
jgi:hypothetical protein